MKHSLAIVKFVGLMVAFIIGAGMLVVVGVQMGFH